jgi:hypothetical protein
VTVALSALEKEMKIGFAQLPMVQENHIEKQEFIW